MLIGFICENGHGYINVEPHGQRICPHCTEERKIKNQNAPYINIVSPDIDKQCKAEGTAVLKTAEARKEADKNKKYNREKVNNEFKKHFDREIRKIF
jgi:hypothetical protein